MAATLRSVFIPRNQSQSDRPKFSDAFSGAKIRIVIVAIAVSPSNKCDWPDHVVAKDPRHRLSFGNDLKNISFRVLQKAQFEFIEIG
jgi:hypothetical protein